MIIMPPPSMLGGLAQALQVWVAGLFNPDDTAQEAGDDISA